MTEHPQRGDGEADLAQCIEEQRKCTDYLKGDGPDKAGALRGLEDWIMAEVLLRIKDREKSLGCHTRVC